MTETRMAIEIAHQPDMLLERHAAWQADAARVRARFAERPSVVLVGRGSSGNACTFAAYLLSLATGRPPIEFRPWLSGQPDVPQAPLSDSVAYAYSVSGESTDITGAARWLGERGAAVVGVTNSESAECRLAGVADELLRLGAGPETAVPATKTFVAQLFVAAALAGHDIGPAAAETAAAMRALLADDTASSLAEFLEGARTITFIARGPALAGALDVALKIQESAGVPAQAYSAAEVLHGPIGSFDSRDRVVLFADLGLGGADSLRGVISALLSRRTPFVVVGDAAAAHLGPTSLPAPLPEPRWARTAVFSFIGQQAALALALRAGLDPDAPRGLEKVTYT